MTLPFKEWIPTQNDAYFGKVGWITPSLELHYVYSFDHIKWLTKQIDLYCEAMVYEAEIDANDDYVSNELNNLEDGEHPEMHRFDGIDDEARNKLLWAAYNKEYIRFGMHNPMRHNYDRSSGKRIIYSVDVTGLSEHLDKLTAHFKYLSKHLPFELTYHPVKQTNKSGWIFEAGFDKIIKCDETTQYSPFDFHDSIWRR